MTATGDDGSQKPQTSAAPPGDTQRTNPNDQIGDGDEVAKEDP